MIALHDKQRAPSMWAQGDDYPASFILQKTVEDKDCSLQIKIMVLIKLNCPVPCGI